MYQFKVECTKSKVFIGISKEHTRRIVKDNMTNKLNWEQIES